MLFLPLLLRRLLSRREALMAPPTLQTLVVRESEEGTKDGQSSLVLLVYAEGKKPYQLQNKLK
jgi:hypothetical protein